MTKRFLLSHNYSITSDVAPPLSIEEFCAVFRTHLASFLPAGDCVVTAVEHPHWRCEVRVSGDAKVVGEGLVRSLGAYRGAIAHQVLALGGLKTTPATSLATGALQPGEWGVDVVETMDAVVFLTTLGWDNLVAGKSEAEVFQVML